MNNDQHQPSPVDNYYFSTMSLGDICLNLQLVIIHSMNITFFRTLTAHVKFSHWHFVQSLQIFCCISIAFKRWLQSTQINPNQD